MGELVSRSEYPNLVKAASGAIARRARTDRRSYYFLVYRDGRIIEEWPQADPRYVDWLDQNLKGVVEAHLVCPDGQVCAFNTDALRAHAHAQGRVVGPSVGLEGRLFQYKLASQTVTATYNKFQSLVDVARFALTAKVAEAPRMTWGQVLGLVLDGEGHCRYGAWVYPGRLIVAEDRFPDVQVRGPQESALYPSHVRVHHS